LPQTVPSQEGLKRRKLGSKLSKAAATLSLIEPGPHRLERPNSTFS